MKRATAGTIAGTASVLLLGALISGWIAWHIQAGDKDDRPHGIAQRMPWTTSHIVGSPEPPLPYKIGRAFPKLTFHNPLLP